MKRVFLLDTMSFVYRAYHAAAHQSIRMTTKAGFPTGATFIFAKMLKKLIETHKPEFLIACMEGGPFESFREKLYPEYKANRKGTPPDDLVRQLPNMERLIEAYNLPRITFPGWEADDVIGTLAKRFYEKDAEAQIFIVTGDKDMFQLVNDRVFVLNPMKDLLADAVKVEQIVGVPPALVTQVMALRGDSIDNVPGAPGVGDKGSVNIIKEFGSLTAALDRASEIKRKNYRESLLNNRTQIELSHKLVTIEVDVPVDLEYDDMVMKEPNDKALKAIYTEFEFASLLGKESLSLVEGFAEVVQPEPPKQTDTRTTLSEEHQDKLIDSIF